MGMLMSEISAATVSEWLKNYSAVISEHANEPVSYTHLTLPTIYSV